MAAFRSRRLEGLFGKQLNEITIHDIESLVDNGVAEDFDLDYKATLYASTDQGKRSLAGDVAAMANTSGGVLILGVEEDKQARASALRPVHISDAEIQRMRQIVASIVAPLPDIFIYPVPHEGGIASDEEPSGAILVAVPQSSRSPHAVLVNDGFRFPRRNGQTTRYLTEPEVAHAYFERWSNVIDRRTSLENLLNESWNWLEGDGPWLSIASVPEHRGDLSLEGGLTSRFFQQYNYVTPSIFALGFSMEKSHIGPGWMAVSDSPVRYGAEFAIFRAQTDGSCVTSIKLPTLPATGRVHPGTTVIDTEEILGCMLWALPEHAAHATLAGATGPLVVGSRISPDGSRLALGRASNGSTAQWGESLRATTTPPEGFATIDIESTGGEIASATASLLAQIGHHFGVSDLPYFPTAESMNRRLFTPANDKMLVSWATSRGVELIDPSKTAMSTEA